MDLLDAVVATAARRAPVACPDRVPRPAAAHHGGIRAVSPARRRSWSRRVCTSATPTGLAAAHTGRAVPLDLVTRAALASDTPFTISDATLPDAPPVWVNPAFEAATGYDSGAAPGRDCRFLQGPGTDRAAVARIRDAVTAGRPAQEVLLNHRADGSAFYDSLAISPLFDGDGVLTHCVGVQNDVTAQVTAGAQRAAAHARLDHALAAERAARADAEAAREQAESAQRRLGLLAGASEVLGGHPRPGGGRRAAVPRRGARPRGLGGARPGR